MNLGISMNFGAVDFAGLTFPTTLRVDYVRVYQDPNNLNVGCDPSDFPTAAYINECVFCTSFLPYYQRLAPGISMRIQIQTSRRGPTTSASLTLATASWVSAHDQYV